MDESKRIPIDQFMSFHDARLVGGNPLNGTGSILWDSMIEAMEAARKERNYLPANPEPMGYQNATRGRAPGREDELPAEGAIAASQLNWRKPTRSVPAVIWHNGVGMPVEMISPELLPPLHPAITALNGPLL